MSFKKLSSYLIRFVGSATVLAIIAGVSVGIRSAIVDYDPISVEMHGTFAQEQNVKVYFAKNVSDAFDNSHMQEFHVNAGESNVKFDIMKMEKLNKIKLEFERNVGSIELSDIKVSCDENTIALNNMNSFNPKNMSSFVIDGNKLTFSSSQISPSVEYAQALNISSSGHVWFFPVNKYSLSLVAIILFAGFWWLLSVIGKINKDIEDAFKN